MDDFIALVCPSCGGRLEIPDGAITMSCKHCGTQYIVKDTEGAISLSVIGELKGIRSGVDKTASALAIPSLKEDISLLERELVRRHVVLRTENYPVYRYVIYQIYQMMPTPIRGRKEKEFYYGGQYLIKLSLEEVRHLLDELRQRMVKARNKEGYPECIASFERIVGVKERIDDLESQIRKHKQIVSQE